MFLFLNTKQQKKFSTLQVSGFKNQGRSLKNFVLNFGPQHPAAHGILRLAMQTSGEVIQRLDPQFGLLHRGSEKLMENRNLLQSLPYFDRFDYVANMFQEHSFCLAIEDLHNNNESCDVSVKAIRTMFDELSRVANHLLTLAAINMDMGAMGPMFWAFEEREQLMEFFERISGARMHTAYYRPFSVDYSPLTSIFFRDLARFLSRSARSLSGAFLGLLNNRALKTRFSNVGQLNPNKLKSWGVSGLIARSSGIQTDLRLSKNDNYGAYGSLSLRTFLGRKGDNWDRFLLRIKEVVESFRIIAQLTQHFNFHNKTNFRKLSFPAPKPNNTIRYKPLDFSYIDLWLTNQLEVVKKLKTTTTTKNLTNPFSLDAKPIRGHGQFSGMEELISHFRIYSEGFPTKAGITYKEVESPKGSVGVFLVTDGSSRPVRVKLRTPVSHNMNLIPTICTNSMFADFVATFASLDIVLGEIDR